MLAKPFPHNLAKKLMEVHRINLFHTNYFLVPTERKEVKFRRKWNTARQSTNAYFKIKFLKTKNSPSSDLRITEFKFLDSQTNIFPNRITIPPRSLLVICLIYEHVLLLYLFGDPRGRLFSYLANHGSGAHAYSEL